MGNMKCRANLLKGSNHIKKLVMDSLHDFIAEDGKGSCLGHIIKQIFKGYLAAATNYKTPANVQNLRFAV